MPRFSVALCTFQGEQYLQSQLQSIVDQSILPSEIVIRDDGSSDGTLRICQDFAAQSPVPVRILPTGERLGVAGNFFTCAKACHSEFIIFADQDDAWQPERLAHFTAAFEACPEAVAILSDGRIVDENLQPTGQTLWASHYFTPAEQALVQQGRAVEVLTRHVFVTGSAMAVRRTWFQTVPYPVGEFYHDEWLGWFAGNALRLLPETTFDYRQHQSQQTGVQTNWRGRLEHYRASQAVSRELLQRDIRRFTVLASQLETSGLAELGGLVQAKIRFVSWRLNLSPFFMIRLFQILKKIASGDYSRFAIQYRSVIKDLFFFARPT